MILRTEDWNRRNKLRKQYGWCSAIVYDQPEGVGPACTQRLRVKEWAYAKLGQPAYVIGDQMHNTQSEWFAGRLTPTEYTIAFEDVRLRNWALLL